MLPDMIFFTGVPGSRWSGIAQEIKQNPRYNKTDRTPDRKYFMVSIVVTLTLILEQVWNLIVA